MVTTVLAVLAFVAGALLVATVLSAIMTLVVPRALPVAITRWVFAGVRALFWLRGRRARSFEERDRVLALYGPISLFSLAATWLVLTGTGYILMFWSLGERPLREALVLSGSWIYTLGFEVPPNLPTTVLAFTEAGFGLVLLAMVISYLPSMYQSFQRREAAVAALDVRAITPPTATAMLIRSFGHRRLGPAGGAVAGAGELVRRHQRDPHLPARAARRRALHPRRVCRPAADRRLLRRRPQPRPALAAGADLGRPPRVRPGLPGAGRGRRAPQARPRAGLARLRRLAGQLRPGAAGPGRADHGPVRAVVLGPVHDRAQRRPPPAAGQVAGVSGRARRFDGPGCGARFGGAAEREGWAWTR